MKISEILKEDAVGLSCELFPPKSGSQLDHVKEAVREMAALRPSYMSITYGASGGTSAYTVDIADEMRNVCHIPTLAHLTCVSSTREQVDAVIERLKEANIENILALRGDIPADADFPLPNQYRYACELIEDIKSRGDFCIGGACYPEGHPEAGSISEDLEHLKEKVDADCDFLTTQMFFDNNIYYNFMYRLLKKNITVPVVAGIMPVTNKAQIERMVNTCGASLPGKFQKIIHKYEDKKEALFDAGMVYALNQIVDLIANDVDGIHIYTMNNVKIADRICEGIKSLI